MSEQITGFFINFTEEEAADIKRRLDLYGYKPDGEGLKELIIESLCDREEGEEFISPTDRLINTATKYIQENPEKIVMGFNALKGFSNMLRKRKPL
jgi:hypothetical protein